VNIANVVDNQRVYKHSIVFKSMKIFNDQPRSIVYKLFNL